MWPSRAAISTQAPPRSSCGLAHGGGPPPPLPPRRSHIRSGDPPQPSSGHVRNGGPRSLPLPRTQRHRPPITVCATASTGRVTEAKSSAALLSPRLQRRPPLTLSSWDFFRSDIPHGRPRGHVHGGDILAAVVRGVSVRSDVSRRLSQRGYVQGGDDLHGCLMASSVAARPPATPWKSSLARTWNRLGVAVGF